jgi:hypothetical protein
MKFHPKGSVSLNATLLTPGGPGSFPGQSEAYFLVEADAVNNIVAGYYLASEFLTQYAPGVASGKPTEKTAAERAAVEALVAELG